MTGNEQQTDPREAAVETAFCDYLQRLDAGEAVDREVFLARHPEIADLLAMHLSADAAIRQMAGPTEAESVAVRGRNVTLVAATDHLASLTETAAQSIDTHPEGDRDRWGIPPQFGRYQVQRLLGQGAMGAVYLAYDTQLERLVALKIPKFDPQIETELRERFYREARAAATLRQPNICPVYDVGEIDGQTFLSMAYIPGQSLAVYSKSAQRLAERSIARLVMKLALALQEAHKHGVVHRDLKPANIMVAENGEPVVMDFGLARRIDSTDTRVTRSGTIVGTPAYMSPEQVEGNPDAVGPPSDQYSLGVILYELLSGQLPFQGTVLAVIGQIAHKKPADIQTVCPEVDQRLANICRKMMAKKPESRFKDMANLAATLNRYLQETKAGATPSNQSILQPLSQSKPTAKLPPTASLRQPGKKHQKAASPRHHRLLAGLAGLVLFVLLGGVIYFVTGEGAVRLDIKDPAVQVTFQDRTFTVRNDGEPIEVRPGNHTMKVKRGDLEFETRRFTVSRNGVADIEITWQDGELLAKNGPDILGRERAELPLSQQPAAGLRLIRRFEGHEQPVKSVDVAPNGLRGASGSGWPQGDNTVRIWNTATGQIEHILKEHKKGVMWVAFAPDNVHLLSLDQDGVMLLWNAETGHLVKQVNAPRRAGEQVEYLSDGSVITIGAEDRHIEIWNLDSGKITKSLPLPAEGFRFALDKAEQRLAVGLTNGQTVCLDLATGGTIRTIPALEGLQVPWVFAVAMTSDGNNLLSAHKGRLRHWNVTTGELIRDLPLQDQGVEAIRITPDDRYAVTGGLSGFVEVFDLTNGQRIAVHRDRLGIRSLDWVPGQQAALVGGGGTKHPDEPQDFALRLWKLPEGVWPEAASPESQDQLKLLEKLEGSKDNIDAVAFSVNGKSLFVASAERQLQEWDLDQKKMVRRMPVTSYITSLAVHPDGEQLFTGHYEGGITLWNLETGRPVREYPGHQKTVRLALSTDGKHLLSASADGLARLWNVETAQPVHEFQDGYCDAAALSLDGKLAAHTKGAQVRVWDIASGQTLQEIRRAGDALGVIAFSPDSQTLATGDYRGAIQVWDITTGQQIYLLQSHTHRVHSLLFTRDGRHLISGSTDQSLRIFSLSSGREILSSPQETLCVTYLALAPDGRTLAGGGGMQALKEKVNGLGFRKDGDFALRLWELPQQF